MILAAGRGERMRPLSDQVPKPLLIAGGKPLIVRQIEAIRDAGIHDFVINASHLAGAMQDALRDGSPYGVHIDWSIEAEPLETAGGIATAYPLFRARVMLIASGDIVTDFPYATLLDRARRMVEDPTSPRVHFVMVPNPDYHAEGDFALVDGMIREQTAARLTFGNIALYDAALFAELPRGTKLKLLPLFRAWIGAGQVSGELYTGRWSNVGTPGDLAELDRQLRMQEKGTLGAAA